MGCPLAYPPAELKLRPFTVDMIYDHPRYPFRAPLNILGPCPTGPPSIGYGLRKASIDLRAAARWEIASFVSAGRSAKERSKPSGTKSGS